MIAEFPAMRTDRLLLRPLREADRRTVIEIQTDPRTNRFNPNPPDLDETVGKFEHWLSHWAEYGFGYVAVIERETGEFLGIGGLQVRDFAGEDVLNLYYRFRPSAWGKGYASEMATTVVDWAEREVPKRPVVISVAHDNVPSIRVAERLGFTDYIESQYDGTLSRHYRREWPKN
jgi:RimJ/RimL family protein N-acetyltransferase